MTNYEWIELLRLIPEVEHGKLVIVLKNGTEICIDTLIRYEDSFLVLRGRVGGSIDESRGFFVPFEQMQCLRLDRIVKVEEIQEFFDQPENSPFVPPDKPLVPPSEQPTPTVPTPTDAASASRLLLERIRAVRASSAAKFPTSM